MDTTATIVSNRNHYKLIELLSVESTNNYAANVSSQDLMSGLTVIMAYNQTKGRGQRGAQWVSEPGKNLTCSIVVSNVEIPTENSFNLSMAVALSIHDALKWYLKKNLMLKWPNDIYIGEKKLGGILIENVITGSNITKSIIGVGLNINQSKFDENLGATSLAKETNMEFNIIELLDQWIPHLKKRLTKMDFLGLKKDYLQRLLWKGVCNTYIYKGKLIEATICDVTKSGHLVLVTNGGSRIEADLKEITKS